MGTLLTLCGILFPTYFLEAEGTMFGTSSSTLKSESLEATTFFFFDFPKEL